MKTLRSIIITFCVVFTVASLAFRIGAQIIPDNEPDGYTRHVVQDGETLWSIASESDCYGKKDIRDIIDDMKVDSRYGINALCVGDIVWVPQYRGSTGAEGSR